MLNLLSNSIKFTEHGGNIAIAIYDKKDHILISVKDTGVGIPQDMLEKIFNPFTQVDPLFRRQAEGNGIGLSLVEMHEGKITATSQLGVGSEFIIKLPVRLVESEFKANIYKSSDLNNNVDNTIIEFSDIYFD